MTRGSVAGGGVCGGWLTPQGHTNSVTSVAYSPNGRQLVSGSTDKTVRVWQVAAGACAVASPVRRFAHRSYVQMDRVRVLMFAPIG